MKIAKKFKEHKAEKKELRETKKELHKKKSTLKNEIENLERVSDLNDDLAFEYTKPKKATTLNVLRYRAMYEDGICEICENIYSFTAEFSNITYQMAGEEEQKRILTKYCELLNYFPHTVNVQVTVRNTFRDNTKFFQGIKMPSGKEYARYAQEINDMLLDKFTQGDNSLVAANYITISFAAVSVQEAVTTAASLKSELRRYFKSLRCGYRILQGAERVKLLSSFFQGDTFSFDYKSLLASGLTTKSYIAPELFDFTEDSSYTFISDENKKYGQTLILKNLPPNMSDRLISELTDTKCDLTFNSFMRPINQESALRMVKNQRAKMDLRATQIQEKNIQRVGNMGLLPFELRTDMENADSLLEDMEKRNQRLFRVTLLLQTTADNPEKLKENVFRLKTAARKCNCDFSDLPEQQEAALNSVLPLGACYIDIERNLTTVNTAIFVPFTNQEIQDEEGLYYGQNATTNNITVINRRYLKNGNCMILGVSGSGKSFTGKEEMAQVLIRYPKDHVLVIDPENEFSPLAERMNGEVIEISAGSKTHLNPLDMEASYGDDESPLHLKGEFILSICEAVLGELSPIAKSLLDKAMRMVYEPFFKAGMDKAATPTLKNICEFLAQQSEAEAKDLATALDVYTNGSLSAFAHKTNADITNRFTVLNTFKLGGQLKTLGMMIVIDYVWNKVIENNEKGIRTWVYVDEMQVFFDSETSSNYFANIWARFRKRNAHATGLTQNVQRILENDVAKYILANSELVIMLDQAKGDRAALAEILDISEEQENYITNADPGSGLIRAGDTLIPVVDKFPEKTELYKIMSTKAEDSKPA